MRSKNKGGTEKKGRMEPNIFEETVPCSSELRTYFIVYHSIRFFVARGGGGGGTPIRHQNTADLWELTLCFRPDGRNATEENCEFFTPFVSPRSRDKAIATVALFNPEFGFLYLSHRQQGKPSPARKSAHNESRTFIPHPCLHEHKRG